MPPNPEQQEKTPETAKEHQLNMSADEVAEMMRDPDFADYFNKITGPIKINSPKKPEEIKEDVTEAFVEDVLPQPTIEEQTEAPPERKTELQKRLGAVKKNQSEKIGAAEESIFKIQQKILELGKQCITQREKFEDAEKKLGDVLFVQGKTYQIDTEGKLKIDEKGNTAFFKDNAFKAEESNPEDPQFHTVKIDEKGGIAIAGKTESGRYKPYVNMDPDQIRETQIAAEQNYHQARSEYDKTIFEFKDEVEKLIPANQKLEKVSHEDDAEIQQLEQQIKSA